MSILKDSGRGVGFSLMVRKELMALLGPDSSPPVHMEAAGGVKWQKGVHTVPTEW